MSRKSMRPLRRIFPAGLLLVVMSCTPEPESEGHLSAILSYTPSCASIKGMIFLPQGSKTYVFQHEISEEFQQQKLPVYVQFKTEKGSVLLTADCIQAMVVQLTSLELREKASGK